MNNHYPQTHSYNRKPDPTRYDWIEDEDAVTEKAAACYAYVVEYN